MLPRGCAAKQRARNTGPLGLHGVSLSAADTTGDRGIGKGSECGGEQPSHGGGHVAVIDLVARSSGGTSHHSKKCLHRQIGRSIPCSLGRGHEQ